MIKFKSILRNIRNQSEFLDEIKSPRNRWIEISCLTVKKSRERSIGSNKINELCLSLYADSNGRMQAIIKSKKLP